MIIESDCVKAMKRFPENYFDAIVTDPPYGLIFMGKEWDKLWDKRKFDEYEYAQKSYTCSDGSTRKTNPVARKIKNPTYRTGIEAQLWHTQWLKEAYRILKPGGSILIMGGARTFYRLACAMEDSRFIIKDILMWLYGQGFPKAQDITIIIDSKILNKTTKQLKEKGWKKAITSEARKWEGFKLGGLKPAYEPIIWGIKPFKGSCTDNVLKYGVGAINVDECRIERDSGLKGRFPANIVLDKESAKILDDQNGNRVGGLGGVSRFFYCAKASGTEKDMGLERVKEKDNLSKNYGINKPNAIKAGNRNPEKQRYKVKNDHPTVKPIKLFEWLIGLVTKEEQVILDPFLGTGTTMIAANNTNRICVGIEKEKEYCKIAKKRVRYWKKK